MMHVWECVPTLLLEDDADVDIKQPVGGGEGPRRATDPVTPAPHLSDQLLVGRDGPALQGLQRGA